MPTMRLPMPMMAFSHLLCLPFPNSFFSWHSMFSLSCRSPFLLSLFPLLFFSVLSLSHRHRKSHGISTESVDDETDTFPISRQWLRNSANKTNRKDNEQRVRKILSGGERKKKEKGQKKGGKKRHRAEHFPRIPSQSLSGSFEKGMVERRRHPDELAPLSQPLGREGSKWDTDNWNSD